MPTYHTYEGSAQEMITFLEEHEYRATISGSNPDVVLYARPGEAVYWSSPGDSYEVNEEDLRVRWIPMIPA